MIVEGVNFGLKKGASGNLCTKKLCLIKSYIDVCINGKYLLPQQISYLVVVTGVAVYDYKCIATPKITAAISHDLSTFMAIRGSTNDP